MEKKINSNLQELDLKDKIIGWRCGECQQPLTEENYNDKNFTLWFDTNMENNNFETFGDRGAKLTIWIEVITHEKTSFYDCPDVETCEGCNKKFLSEIMKVDLRDKKVYLCPPCFDGKWANYLVERAKRKQITPEQKEVMRIIQKAVNEHLASNYHKGGHDYSKCSGSECEGYKSTLESYGYERIK